MLDIAAIVAAQYAQLATDSAGAQVRAAVAGIITADDLDKPLPGDLFVAFRERPIGGQSYEIRPIVAEWWIYDVRSQGTTRINHMLNLIQTAYEPFSCIPHCDTRITQIGAPQIDTTRNRMTRFLQLTSYTRG